MAEEHHKEAKPLAFVRGGGPGPFRTPVAVMWNRCFFDILPELPGGETHTHNTHPSHPNVQRINTRALADTQPPIDVF